MTNHQLNKYAMYLIVINVLDKFGAVIMSIPAFVRLVASFKKLVADIGKKSEEIDKGTSGETKAKLKNALDMAEVVAGLVGSLHAYACEGENEELMHKSDVSATQISGRRDPERADFAKSLLDLVEENKSALTDWGVTDEDIAAARALVEASEASVGKRNTTRTGQEGERESLDALFARGDRILKKQIDRLVRRLRKNNPEFRAEYDAARVIKDIAATRAKGAAAPPAAPAPVN